MLATPAIRPFEGGEIEPPEKLDTGVNLVNFRNAPPPGSGGTFAPCERDLGVNFVNFRAPISPPNPIRAVNFVNFRLPPPPSLHSPPPPPPPAKRPLATPSVDVKVNRQDKPERLP